MATPLRDYIVAYGFEEGSGPDCEDQGPDGLTGTLTGASRGSTGGKFGEYITFGGDAAHHVRVSHDDVLNLQTLTISAWVWPDSQASWDSVIAKRTSTVACYFLYSSGASPGWPDFYIHPDLGGSDLGLVANNPIPQDAWTHIAGTFDGTTMRLFINGVENASSEQASGETIETGVGDLEIGSLSLWGETFDGRIDDVRIYDYAQTAQQITDDMAESVVQAGETIVPLAGDITAASTVAGAVDTQQGLTSTVTATSTTSATADLQQSLSSTIVATSAVTGAVDSQQSLTSTITATSTATGAVNSQQGLTSSVAAVSTVAGAVDTQQGLTSTVTAISTATGALSGIGVAAFSIVDVDDDNEISQGQTNVAIHCIDAGAVEGIVEYGGIEQAAGVVDWPAVASGASTITITGAIDTSGLSSGSAYDMKVYKPV